VGKLSKPAGKANVKPEQDWRIEKVIEIDAYTSAAVEVNGVGTRRAFDPRGARRTHDQESENELSTRRADVAKAAKLAWREQKLEEADELISQLRREYQARGRVLRWADLSREIRARQRAKDEREAASRQQAIGGVLDGIEDEWARVPVVRVDQPREPVEDDVPMPGEEEA
jgi:hypothetical protein